MKDIIEKAVILAAGLGSRLRPITDTVPKCMVPVNGIPIIERQIQNLLTNGINDITIVTGYKKSILESFVTSKFPHIHFVDNDLYDCTNNMFSLFLTKDRVINHPFLILNADVFFDPNIIQGLCTSDHENMIACDYDLYNEESMKITVDKTGRIEHISKQISEAEAFATSIDIYKLGTEAGEILFDIIHDYIENKKEKNLWTEVALDKIFPMVEFVPFRINGRWLEIDNHDDLAAANLLFNDIKSN